jgi:YhcN/YlaJ family sporulation lipoprotein
LLKYFFTIVITAALILIGCNHDNNDTAKNNNNENGVVPVRNTEDQKYDRISSQKKAEHLVKLASGVPGVKDATAVVLGNIAVVGIDVDAKLERSDVDSIKYTVAESLKDDPHGADAIVIADPDVMERLREINEDIKNGAPIMGIMNELSDIVGRLMPEVPADLEDPKPKNAVDQPKDKLNKKNEKQNLEDKQEKQSNHYKDKP